MKIGQKAALLTRANIKKTQLFTKMDIVNFKSNLIFLKIAQHGGIIFRDKTPKENVKTRTFQQKYKYLLFLKHLLGFFKLISFTKKNPPLKASRFVSNLNMSST